MKKIKDYKIHKHGARGQSISLNTKWMNRNNLKIGDSVAVHEDEVDGEDALVIMPGEKQDA